MIIEYIFYAFFSIGAIFMLWGGLGIIYSSSMISSDIRLEVALLGYKRFFYGLPFLFIALMIAIGLSVLDKAQ